MRGKARVSERDEERSHLAGGEFVAGFDRGLARHRGRESLVASVRSAVAIPAQRCQRLSQAPFGVESRMRHWHAVDEKRVSTETLDLEAELRERFAMRLECVSLDWREVQTTETAAAAMALRRVRESP